MSVICQYARLMHISLNYFVYRIKTLSRRWRTYFCMLCRPGASNRFSISPTGIFERKTAVV